MSELNASNDSHEAWNKVVEWLSKQILTMIPVVTGAAFPGITMDQFFYASLLPHPLLVHDYYCNSGHVMCDTQSIGGGDVTDC